MFQSTVLSDIAAGIVGELAFEGPLNGQPAVINSGDATQNVVGRAFTHNTGDLSVRAGGTATGIFAGILANPKVYPNGGTAAGGTLAASLTLPNGTIGEFVQNTPGIYVVLAAPAAIGDRVTYAQATGVLGTTPPLTAPGAGLSLVPNAVVVRYTVTAGGGGLAVIALNGPVAVPGA